LATATLRRAHLPRSMKSMPAAMLPTQPREGTTVLLNQYLGDWERGAHAITCVAGGPVAVVAGGWPRARRHPGRRAARRTVDLLAATVRRSLAASANEVLVEDLLEIPKLRSAVEPPRKPGSSLHAAVGPHDSFILRPPPVMSELSHPLTATPSVGTPCGRSTHLSRLLRHASSAHNWRCKEI
jgi:hypothetical protein